MSRTIPGGGIITYQVTLHADDTNTYALKNVKINDALQGFTEDKYLPYLTYEVGSFVLKRKTAAGTEEAVTIGANPHGGTNPAIVDNETTKEKRFDLYIEEMEPGETLILTYRVHVAADIFTVDNHAIKIKNTAAAYSDDTGALGAQQMFSSESAENTLEKKVWDRKLQSEKTDAEQNVEVGAGATFYRYQEETASWQPATAENSFPVPAGSFPYQVAVNESGGWNVSSSIFKDKLENQFLLYTGYLRVDYYTEGITGSPASDAEAIASLKGKPIAKTVWADIDGRGSFGFSPQQLGFPTDQAGAFVLTYYAKPNGVDTITQVESGNAFTLEGQVFGPGGVTLNLSGVTVRTTTVIQGGGGLKVQKSGWYYDPLRQTSGEWQNGKLYWVVDVTGVLKEGMEFRDVPYAGKGSLHYVRASSVAGLYMGSVPEGKAFTEYYVSIEDLEADSAMTKLQEGTDYSWTVDSAQSGVLTIKKDQNPGEGRHIYMVLRTSLHWNRKPRESAPYYNELWFKDLGADRFTKINEAVYLTGGAGANFKELAGVYEYDGASWSDRQCYNGNSHTKLVKEKITSPGTYVDWRIKINFAGELEGSVQVEDLIPEGLAPVYVRYFWIPPEIFSNPPQVPAIPELEGNAAWTRMELTGRIDGSETGGVNRTCISYFNSDTRQLRFCVDNLQKGGSKGDQRSLEIQVVTRLSDPDMLLAAAAEKSYTNTITVKNASQKIISTSAADATLEKQTIVKEMKMVKDGKLPFELIVNSLGEDLAGGAEKLTLVDEMKAPLQFDTKSLKIVDAEGNPVTYQSEIQDTAYGQKLTLIVPNKKKLIITYSAILNSPPETPIYVENAAYWLGHKENKIVLKKEDLRYASSATAGTSHTPILRVSKADKNNTATALNGAKFRLQEVTWDSAAGQWTEKAGGRDLTGITGSTGYPEGIFPFGNSSGTALAYNTVYRLTETQAPEGYIPDSQPRYYAIAQKDAATGTYPAELAEWSGRGVTIYYYSSTYDVTVYNKKGRLRLEKTFQNVNGEKVTGAGIPDGVWQFGLYACRSDGTYDSTSCLQKLEIICTSGTLAYRLDGVSVAEPEFTQLSAGSQYSVLELDRDGNPISTTGTVAAMKNGLTYRVDYTGGIRAVTIPADGTEVKVEITNRQYVNMEPGTGIFTESNLVYGSLLGGIGIVGILFWISRRRRDR